jgi:hypothetical protein
MAYKAAAVGTWAHRPLASDVSTAVDMRPRRLAVGENENAAPPPAPPPPYRSVVRRPLGSVIRNEFNLWYHRSVLIPGNRILVLGTISSIVYFMFLLVLCTFSGLCKFWPPWSVGWPVYGAVFQIGQLAMFALGWATQASQAMGYIVLNAFLTFIVMGFDILAVVALIDWLLGFYIGVPALTAAQLAAMPTSYGALTAAGVTGVLIILDVLTLLTYLQLITAVNYIRANLRLDSSSS